MAREYTIPFEFQDKAYQAFVQLGMQGKDLDIQVSLPDESLREIIPNGKLDYNSKSGLSQEVAKNQLLAQELVGCVVRAIEKHLYAAY